MYVKSRRYITFIKSSITITIRIKSKMYILLLCLMYSFFILNTSTLIYLLYYRDLEYFIFFITISIIFLQSILYKII